jgi:hypothetical protein
MWMRSGRVVRASDILCRSRNCPGFDPSILRHSGIWGAANEAVLIKVLQNDNVNPPGKKNIACSRLCEIWQNWALKNVLYLQKCTGQLIESYLILIPDHLLAHEKLRTLFHDFPELCELCFQSFKLRGKFNFRSLCFLA